MANPQYGDQSTCHGIVAIRAWFAFDQILLIVHTEGWKYLHWACFSLLPEPHRLEISLLFFVHVDPHRDSINSGAFGADVKKNTPENSPIWRDATRFCMLRQWWW